MFRFNTRGSGRRVCWRLCVEFLVAQSSLSGGLGVVKSSSLYTRWRRFWYACQRVGRTSTSEVLFVSFGCSILSECVCGEVGVSLHSAGGFGMHARGLGGLAYMTFFLHAFGHSVFLKRQGRMAGFGGFLPSAVAFLVCMSADRKGKRAGHFSL